LKGKKETKAKSFFLPIKRNAVRKKCPSHGKSKVENSPSKNKCNKGCITHCGLALYIRKYLNAKAELYKS